jgi:hypothetical protein
MRSGDVMLLREWDLGRGEQDYNQYRQWSDNDFALIFAQIEQAIKDLGWTP